MPRHSLHALLEDGVPPGLADDQVGPLDDDDADEEGRVAGELHDLPLLVGLQGGWKQEKFVSADQEKRLYGDPSSHPITDPLLAVAVLQVVDVLVVPGHSDVEQRAGQEAVLRQDDEVGEEAGQSLDHTCRRERERSGAVSRNRTHCSYWGGGAGGLEPLFTSPN